MSDKIERIIDALRKKILDAAIRGELVPQNPEDEPASVLLERIATEREKLIKEKKIKKPKGASRIFRRDGHFYESINGGAPTCIDDDIPFEIPDSWEWIRLSNILSVSSGKSLSTNKLEDNGAYPVYGGNGIVGRYSSNNVDSGTLLIGRVGALCGNTHITKSPAWVTDNALICAFDSSKIHIDYLRIAIDSLELRHKSNSTAQPVITGKIIYPSLIPLPPYSEQHRIIQGIEHRLGVLLLIKDSRSRYKRILSETPTSLRQQLIQAAIQGQLVPQNPNDEPARLLLERIAQERTAKLGKKAAKSMRRIERRGSKTYELFPDGSEKDISDEIPFEIPAHWEWARLENLGNSNLGKTLDKAKNTGELHSYLCSINVYWNGISLDTLKQALFEPEELTKYSVERGDLLICEGGDVGRAAVWEECIPMCYQNALHRVRFYCCFNPYFVKALLEAYKADGTVDEMSKGMTIKHLVQGSLKKMLVPVPPLEEQHRIIKKLGALLKSV